MNVRPGLLALLTLASSCGEAVHARSQLLVFVDTDALIADQALRVEQRADDESWSGGRAHLALDTLRVDLIAKDGSIVDYLDVVAPAAEQWPISFGIAAEGAERDPLIARLRLFSGEFAARGQNEGESTLEPDASVTIDRVIELNFPDEGVRRVGVFMATDCLGTPAQFAPNRKTCLDGDSPVRADRAFVDLEQAWTESRVGTWEGLREVACSGEQPAGSVCVEGGFFYFGDRSLALPPLGVLAPSYPLRPVLSSPFWIDRDEFTVGRLLEVMASNTAPTLLDESELAFFPDCTWRNKDEPENAAMPLNCITARDAERVCQAVGGQLPSEAQWEYAARGHAARWQYPWGDEFPDCCTARLSRLEGSDLAAFGMCPGYGPLPFESATVPTCRTQDISIDGVRDMAGNLSEPTLDEWIGLDEASECWPQAGILRDPTCRTEEGAAVKRGGECSAGVANAVAALRSRHYVGLANPTQGFRCVYEVSQ